jgi:hypothetical protein
MTHSWAEEMRSNAGLRVFVEMHIAQAVVELAALKAEFAKQARMLEAMDQEVRQLRKRVK